LHDYCKKTDLFKNKESVFRANVSYETIYHMDYNKCGYKEIVMQKFIIITSTTKGVLIIQQSKFRTFPVVEIVM